MTMIIWDGKQLVADKYVSHPRDKREGLRNATHTTKINTFENVEWTEGDYLLACAFTGTLSDFSDIKRTIKASMGKDTLSHVKEFLDLQLRLPAMGLIFITQKRVHIFRCNTATELRGRWSWRNHPIHPKKEFVCLGSAEYFSQGIVDLFDAQITAREVLFLTTMTDRKLGGGFDQWSMDNQCIRKGRCLTSKQKQALMTRMGKRVQGHSIND